jgi:hypothetical protein
MPPVRGLRGHRPVAAPVNAAQWPARRKLWVRPATRRTDRAARRRGRVAAGRRAPLPARPILLSGWRARRDADARSANSASASCNVSASPSRVVDGTVFQSYWAIRASEAPDKDAGRPTMMLKFGLLAGALAVSTVISPGANGAAPDIDIGQAAQVVNSVYGAPESTHQPRWWRSGLDVFHNETVVTAESSASRVIFKDASQLSIGPTSLLKLDNLCIMQIQALQGYRFPS